jgi:ribose transport system permease protein
MSDTTSSASAAAFAQAELKKQRVQALIRTLGMLPVLLVMCILFQVLTLWVTGEARFLSWRNLAIIAEQASINTVIAAGMTFVILTGGIDLSVGSILAAAAVVALQVSQMPGLGWLTIPAGLAAGLLFGLVNGALIALLKLPPFIVTLGSLTAVRGVARLLANDTTVFNMEAPHMMLMEKFLGFPWLVYIAIVVVFASWFILRRTVLGMHVYAVGGNESAARLSGISVPKVLLFVYGMSGLCAGLGAIMVTSRLGGANGLQLGQSYELDAIAAVILGGTSFVGGIGSIWGTLIGALIIAVLSNGLVLLGVPDVWQYIVKGLVIIGAVLLDRFRLGQGART